MPALCETPWGEIEIADAHVHFFSPAFFQSLAEQKNNEFVPKLLGWDEPASSEALAMRWAAELDENKIARAMLIASIPNDTTSLGCAIETSPSQFAGVYMASPQHPGADIRFNAAYTDDHISGVFLFPSMHHYSMHDDKVSRLLQVVAGHPNPIVYVHCGVLSVGFRKTLGLPCPFDMRYANPIDLHAVATHFSRINFVIPHFGAGFFSEALMVADQCPNVYLDTSSSNSWIRYQTDNLDLSGVFRKAIDVLGPKRILFGSDSSWFPRGYVRGVLDEQIEILHRIGVDEEGARNILGGNFRRLLRLD
jgi:predicted TIM-barrel fold metal-dependent hydrolase